MGVARNARMQGNGSCASSRRWLAFPHYRGKHRLILYCLKLNNLIVRDTLFVKRILSPRFYAGDNDPACPRDPGTRNEELAGLIRLIEVVSVRLSTHGFLHDRRIRPPEGRDQSEEPIHSALLRRRQTTDLASSHSAKRPNGIRRSIGPPFFQDRSTHVLPCQSIQR